MIYNQVVSAIENALSVCGFKYDKADIALERPKKAEYGDISSAIALKSARLNKMAPIKIAQELIKHLEIPIFKSAEIAAPGFINFTFSEGFLFNSLKTLLTEPDSILKVNYGGGKRVLLEFVSANPTGPLHIGHGRGAGYGDSLARIMKQAGYAVDKEYYINDAGNQMHILGRSLLIRALQQLDFKIEFPEDHYKGKYINDIAKQLIENGVMKGASPAWLESGSKIAEFAHLAEKHILQIIKDDLKYYNVEFDNFFSERTLHAAGKIAEAVEHLRDKGLIEDKDGAIWYKSSKFGDDKDRVLIRKNGEPTYFAADIAYHKDKFERDYDIALDIWGQDHHGYVKRLKTAVDTLGFAKKFEVILYQLVSVKGLKLSTRQGQFITLRELLDDIGSDAMRFFSVLRSHNSHLDFDVNLAKQQNNENPVFYVQYAHARINSITKKYGKTPDWQITDFNKITEPELIEMIKELIYFPTLITNIARTYEVQMLPHYLMNLAGLFHKAYNKYSIIKEEEPIANARLGLITAVKNVLAKGLELIGVAAPETM